MEQRNAKTEEDGWNRQVGKIRIEENANSQQQQRDLEVEVLRIKTQGQNKTEQNTAENGSGRKEEVCD